jgi:hypothetical protein
MRENTTSEDSYIIETDLMAYHDGGGGDDDALKFTSGKTNQIWIKPSLWISALFPSSE